MSNIRNLADALTAFAANDSAVVELALRDKSPHKWTRIANYAAERFEHESGWPHHEPLFTATALNVAARQIAQTIHG